jgi:hypothetical protein
VIRAHFHGGPWAGEHREIEPVDALITDTKVLSITVANGQRETKVLVRGYYRRDHASAGGRCYDWQTP